MASNQPVSLQGSVKKEFDGTPTFQDFLNKNPDFPTWAPPEQNELADKFFKEKTADFTPDEKIEARSVFNKTYNLGGVTGGNFQGKPFQELNPLDKLSTAVDAAALTVGSVVDPAHDLLNPFDRNASQRNAQIVQKAYPGIETDPGFLGDAYRLHQNRYANMVGQGLGAFGAVRNIATRLPEQALAKFPLLAKLPADAQNALAATGIFSGLVNTADVAHGKQNPVEAIGNTALDVVTAPLGGNNRLLNASIQGASGLVSGAASSALSDLSRGQPIDLKRLQQMALEQGAIGFGTGAAFGGKRPQVEQSPVRRVRGLDTAREQAAQLSQSKALQAQIIKRQQEIAQAQAVTEQKTISDRLTRLNQLYKQLDEVERSAPPIVGKRAAAIKAQVQKEYNRVQAEKETKFPSKKPAKAQKTLTQGQLPNAVRLGIKAVKAGGVQRKRFNDVVKGYIKADQDRIRKGIEDALKSEKSQAQTEATRAAIRREAGKEKAQEIAQQRQRTLSEEKARIKEAEKLANSKPKNDPERKKLEKAIEEAKNRTARREQREAEATRKKELTQLREDIIARSTTQKQAEAIKEKAKSRGEEPAQSQEGMANT